MNRLWQSIRGEVADFFMEFRDDIRRLDVKKLLRKYWRRIRRPLKEALLKCCLSMLRVRVLLIVVVLYLVFFLLRGVLERLLADRIGFEAARSVLTMVVAALASLLGIVVAVLLVAFEILRKGFNVYAFRTFFENEKLRDLVHLFVATIVVGAASLFLLSAPLTSFDIARVVLVSLLFLGCVTLLFPHVQRIITSTQPTQQARAIVESIEDYFVANRYWRPHLFRNRIKLV